MDGADALVLSVCGLVRVMSLGRLWVMMRDECGELCSCLGKEDAIIGKGKFNRAREASIFLLPCSRASP